ncbi:hypothetical protein PENSPDRAFT_755138 [Peniophora sp. CONT]|nr:hypothetical protein PENSPDRAFT_755138 [Peniophora sp. CONT]
MHAVQFESRSASPSRSLSRGQACVACRQRKIKCDGTRPVCGQCTRARRPQECHFEGVTRSRVQVLEESIQALEARIKELEHEGPGASPSSVYLHPPHASPSTSSFVSPPHSPRALISSNIYGILINVFFENTSALPWFLHDGRVRQALELPDGDIGHPVTVLNTVMLLWGSILHSSISLETIPQSASPPQLLDQALTEVGQALVDASAQHIIQLIQAHVLLAVHLMDIGRYLESRAHVDAAAALSIHVGLHKIRGTLIQVSHGSYLDPINIVLPEPLDAVEEGERIRAFWFALVLDCIYAVVLGVPPLITAAENGDMPVDTPWPLDMTLYQQGQMPPTLRSNGTLRSFFDGTGSVWPWDSTLSQLSGASLLFERSSKLAASWRPDLSNSTAYYAEFLILDQRLNEFEIQLPALSQGAAPQLYLAHSLAYAGRIQLHSMFAQQMPVSRASCLNAARAILNATVTTQVETFVFIDSVIGCVWAAACRVLINEIVTLRNNALERPLLTDVTEEVALIRDLDSLLAFMASLSATSGAMNFHFSRIQQERIVLG